VDVILRRVGRIIGGPLHHRERTALEGDEIEEPASVIERDAVLNLDDACRARAIFEHAFFDLHRAVGRTDE
jgi:hypothetical protein